MKKFFATFIVLFMLPITLFGQVVVGTYRLAATGRDYVVLVDDIPSDGSKSTSQLNNRQIYIQVETDSSSVQAFIKLTSKELTRFMNTLNNQYSKALNYFAKKPSSRKKIGKNDVVLYLKKHDDIYNVDIYGYESGVDYDIFMTKNPNGTVLVSYIGESAKSEDEVVIKINGWRFVISSTDEIKNLSSLLSKASAMIKNNSTKL